MEVGAGTLFVLEEFWADLRDFHRIFVYETVVEWGG
jgi:hypothetical protein